MRHCNFSTGPFVEPIEVWDERASWPMALEIRADATGATGMMAEELGLKRRWIIPVPVLTPRLSSYWVNFATTGNPSGKGLPPWPAVTKEAPQTMEVGDDFRPIPLAATPARIASVVEEQETRRIEAATAILNSTRSGAAMASSSAHCWPRLWRSSCSMTNTRWSAAETTV